MSLNRYIRFFSTCIIISTFFACSVVSAEDTIIPVSVVIKKTLDHTPIVFILPHQDDELFVAGTIQKYKHTGRKIHVVMVSDGGSSSARFTINGKNDEGKAVFCALHRRVHNPKKEGYLPLSVQKFSQARNEEFIRSLQALGIARSQIQFMNKGEEKGVQYPEFRDGLLFDNAKEAIARIYATYGDGTYITLSGGHSDHVALQEALKEAKGISEKLFFPLDHSDITEHTSLSITEQKNKEKAVRVYGEWAPKKRRFAIGEHSVKFLLDVWNAKEPEYFYR